MTRSLIELCVIEDARGWYWRISAGSGAFLATSDGRHLTAAQAERHARQTVECLESALNRQAIAVMSRAGASA